MAITKHYIDTSDTWNSLFEILQENATDFFDSIEFDGTTITCKVGTDIALKINHVDSTYNKLYKICTKGGNYQLVTGSDPKYVVVTSKGIMIHSDTVEYTPTDLFICKTDAGTLAFAVIGVYYSSSYYKRFWVVDYENSTNIGYYLSTDSSTSNWVKSQLSPYRDNLEKTSFATIPIMYCNSHLDGVYQLVYNQYYNVYGEITDGEGNSYFSNGCLAIAD